MEKEAEDLATGGKAYTRRDRATVSKGSKSAEERCSGMVRRSAPKIVGKLLEQAREGSVQHAKFLFDLIGFQPKASEKTEEDIGENGAGESLAALLLKKLDEGPAEPEPAQVE
jgi:hypothetical protein